MSDGPGKPGEWDGSVIPPGETCGLCNRRVPLPKKPSSPSETHPLSFGRAPADIVQELKDRVNALSEDAGLSKLPYPQARTVMLLLTLAEVVSRETLLEVASGMSWGTKPAECAHEHVVDYGHGHRKCGTCGDFLP